MEKLSRFLSGTVKDLNAAKGIRGQRIHQAWPKVVGELLARQSQPLVIKGSTLYVRVSAAAWAQELQLRQRDILERLAKELGQNPLRDLRCRVGSVERTKSLVQDKPPSPNLERVTLEPARLAEIKAVAAGLNDPALREKLEKVMIAQSRREKLEVARGRLPCPLCGRFREAHHDVCPGCRRERESERTSRILRCLSREPWLTQRDMQAQFPDLSGAEYHHWRGRLRSLLKRRVWEAFWELAVGDVLPSSLRATMLDLTMLSTSLPVERLDTRHLQFTLGERLAKCYFADRKLKDETPRRIQSSSVDVSH
ncbi:MAG: DciA family protein [Vulcanimicrobiota bacterium]